MAKSANLLVDGLDAPQRIGLLLPLHWQSVALLLAGVATGATVVVAADPAELAGCAVAFVTGEHAMAALEVGVDEVLALSGHPLGAPLASVPASVTDFAREVPTYGDHWGGPPPARWNVEVAGQQLGSLPELGVGPEDRVLMATEFSALAGLTGLLAVLHAGAAAVLAPHPGQLDLAAVSSGERLTAAFGLDAPGLRSLQLG